MNKDPKILDSTLEDDPRPDDLGIENQLKPKCEFHVSSGFKERVMAETRVISKHRRRHWIFPAAASVAAVAVAVIAILAVFHLPDKKTHTDKKNVITSVETQSLTPEDTINKNIQSEFIAKATPVKQTQSTTDKSSPGEKAVSRRQKRSQSPNEDKTRNMRHIEATEGAMPMVINNEFPDPDEVRTRLIESRRNAEIAYIEQMRDEIEANQAYISQLMTEENLYQ